jgi:hypothetical protein
MITRTGQVGGPRRWRLQLDEHKLGQQDEQAEFACQLVVRSINELNPHPSYVRHELSVSASQLSALAELGSLAIHQPIVISRSGIVVDGYARWELARLQGRQKILCLEYELTEEEALRWLIQTHHPLRGLNSYCRTLLALDLAPSLQEAARTNQRLGGKSKSSSNLTEAQKVDVRSKTAATAGVSSGNVSKGEEVSRSAPPGVQQALRSGEIRVHKAWQWRRLSPQEQQERLEESRSQKGTNLTSRRLIQKHAARLGSSQLVPPTLGELLKPLLPDRATALDSIVVSEIAAPGRIAYFTQDALSALRRGGAPT